MLIPRTASTTTPACFYDDPSVPVGGDADTFSLRLREDHQVLGSKALPTGGDFGLRADWYGFAVTRPEGLAHLRLSSDTIASTHNNYRHRRIDTLWASLSTVDQERYDRGFYTIGGFVVFPRHSDSLNQRRGTDGRIDDRFDLTLECIRRYYQGITGKRQNPLGDVLSTDAAFFGLFGKGDAGFNAYVDFFHLGDLVSDGQIRWFDDFEGDSWDFVYSPLPQSIDAYTRYLDNVLRFVNDRNLTITKARGAHRVSDA